MVFLRSTDNALFETAANWALFNPIVPANVLLVTTDTGGMKISDGTSAWSDLTYTTGGYIGEKPVETGTPLNHELIEFSSTNDQFEFRLRGVIDTEANWVGSITVFPTFAILVETSNTSPYTPTGRLKIADGYSTFASLPYYGGIHVFNQFATGITNNSVEFDGYEWVPKDYWGKDDIPYPTVATGKVLHDNLQWVAVETITTPITTVINNIATYGDTTGDTLLDSGVSITTFPTSSPGETFQINSNSNGPKLKNNSGELQLRNSTDTAYADLQVKNIEGEFATFTNGEITTLNSTSITTTALNGEPPVTLDDVIVYSIVFGG